MGFSQGFNAGYSAISSAIEAKRREKERAEERAWQQQVRQEDRQWRNEDRDFNRQMEQLRFDSQMRNANQSAALQQARFDFDMAQKAKEWELQQQAANSPESQINLAIKQAQLDRLRQDLSTTQPLTETEKRTKEFEMAQKGYGDSWTEYHQKQATGDSAGAAQAQQRAQMNEALMSSYMPQSSGGYSGTTAAPETMVEIEQPLNPLRPNEGTYKTKVPLSSIQSVRSQFNQISGLNADGSRPPVEITSEEQYNSLKPGTIFNYQGKTLTKR